MNRLALKSLWARRVRALTTTLAVVIGVAFVAGTYILTDTTLTAFDELFADSLSKTDVVVTARDEVRQETMETPTFEAGLLRKVKRVDGVRVAAGEIFTPGALYDAAGEPVGSKFAPKVITSNVPLSLETLVYAQGRRARTANEVALDQGAADDAGLRVGDKLKVASVERAKTYKLVGLTKLGNASFGGASIAQLTLREAQRITGNLGRFDRIWISARPGVSARVLKRRVEQVVPADVRVETAEENVARATAQVGDDLGFLRVVLLVFAFVAVFVGAFLIFNTFSITVAQRIAEFGMLRTLGAARGQILKSVVVEALAIGVVGALVGLAAGIGVASGLNALFVAVGIDLPSTSMVIEPRTVAVASGIGVGVTLASSIVPALRSTRVPPIAALRGAELRGAGGHQRLQAALASLLGAVGMALVAFGLLGDASSGTAAALMGAGAVAVILGVSLISPRLVPPLAALAGRPLEMARRLIGRLARENAQRNPARTAVTAAALMIGLAVVAFVTVFASGIKQSISTAVDQSFQGELVLQSSDGFSPISPGAAAAARNVRGVRLVSTLRAAEAKLQNGRGGQPRISALDRNAGRVLSIDWKQGGPSLLRRLEDRQVILDRSFADRNGFGLGDRVRLLTQVGERVRLTVVGEFEDKADLFGSAIVTQRLMRRRFGQRDDFLDFVKLAPGVRADAVQSRIGRVIERDFPVAQVLNQQELKENQEAQVNELLGLIYALLGLAVLISLFGIANTLALSIHERTRELGMLRAIGMSRRQVRAMIRYEAVITALIGAILGMALGAIFAAVIAQPLEQQGFTLSYPVLTLGLMLVFSGLAGVVAAIAPARRASGLDVLDALHYE